MKDRLCAQGRAEIQEAGGGSSQGSMTCWWDIGEEGCVVQQPQSIVPEAGAPVPLLLPFCWDSLEKPLLGHVFPVRKTRTALVSGHIPEGRGALHTNLRAFASRWFVFLCVTVFLSGVRSSNWIWPKAKSHVTNPSSPRWPDGRCRRGGTDNIPPENRSPRAGGRSWLLLPDTDKE